VPAHGNLLFNLTQCDLTKAKKGEHITWVLALFGQDVVTFIINIAAVVRAGQTSVNILSYLVHQQRISSGSRRTFFKSPTTPIPAPLPSY
jgi:catabolite regulation protein CreA